MRELHPFMWRGAAALSCWMLIAPALSAEAESEKTEAEDKYEAAREAMVRTQIEARGVKDEKVLAAMRKVKRDRFVLRQYRERAYGDYPLPIGEGQTISQPYIVALMTELLDLDREDKKEKVLEIGTGSGYQAAVLAQIVDDVYSVEIIPSLAKRARKTLDAEGHIYGRGSVARCLLGLVRRKELGRIREIHQGKKKKKKIWVYVHRA